MTYSERQSEPSVRDRLRKVGENQKNYDLNDESWLDYGKRNVAQLASRGTELLLGLPGNIKGEGKKTGEEIASFEDYLFPQMGQERQKIKEENRLGKEKYKKENPNISSLEDLIFNPPSTAEIREKYTPKVAKAISGREDYLEPQGEGEKFAGDLTQDLLSFFMPGTGQMRLVTRIGAPLVGNLAKQGIKFITGDESIAEKAKMGLMLAATLAGQSNPQQYARSRIRQAKAMIPQDTTVHAGRVASLLIPLYNRLTRGLNVPSKSRAMEGMRELAGQVENNRLSMHSLMDARDNINEWISEAGGWDVPPNTREATMMNLNELKRQLIDTIEDNMRRRFPDAENLYRTGYEASAVTHQSNAISNFIESHFGKNVASAGAKILFPSLAGGAAFLPKTAILGSSFFPVYKLGQVLYRISRSPTLANYYQGVLTNAMRGNAPAMIKSLNKLDAELKKDEKENPKVKEKSLEKFKQRFIQKD